MDQRSGGVGRVDAIDANDDDVEETEVEVTRAQIEQTRSEMSETVEAIKDKLNPRVLMSQAKETVTDVAGTLAQRAKETVHDVTSDVLSQAKANLPEMTSNLAHQAVDGAVSEAKEVVGNAVRSASAAVGDAVDTARDAGSSVIQMIERNPLPTALLATSLGWLWINYRRQAEAGRNSGRRDTKEYLRRYDDPWRQYDAPSQTGVVATGASSAAQALRGAQDRVGEVAGQIQDKAGQLVEQTQDGLSRLGSATAHQVEQTADVLQRTLRQNPMAAGAVALGMGAALALLIPETPRENQWMGEARDRVLHKAQETVQEVGLKAQIVAEEAIGAAKQEAKA